MLRRSFRCLSRLRFVTEDYSLVLVSTSTEWNAVHTKEQIWSPAFGSHRSFFTRNSSWDVDPDVAKVDTAGSESLDSVLNPSYIVDLAQASDSVAFAQEALNHWPLISGVQSALQWLHVSTGLPWWLTIPLMTISFRLLVFPVMLVQIKNTYRLNNAKPEADAMMELFQKRLAQGDDPMETRRWYMDQIGMIWKKHNCSPVRSMIPLVANGFLFVSFYISLQGLADIKVPSMCYEGTLWFPDLTQSDKSYGLPVLSSLILWVTVELGAADGMQGNSPEMVARMKNILRVLAVVLIPLTAKFPASVFCYWITSNLFSFGQAMVLKNEQVRDFLGVPRPRVSKDPIKEMVGRPILQVDGKLAKTKIIKEVNKESEPLKLFVATRQKKQSKKKKQEGKQTVHTKKQNT